jgi:hypothetical protein
MKKLLLFAAVAGLGLVSASPPGKGPDYGPREMRRHYPPCSRTITDRCIQLYERGVRARMERDDQAMDEMRGRPDRYADDDHLMRRDRFADDDHRWRRDRDGDGDRHWRRFQIADDDRRWRRHGDGDGDGDGGHRWCPEHHAYDGGHHDRMMVERVMVERRHERPVVMAARVTRVVGCRCAQPPRRQLAQRVRRAGERG